MSKPSFRLSSCVNHPSRGWGNLWEIEPPPKRRLTTCHQGEEEGLRAGEEPAGQCHATFKKKKKKSSLRRTKHSTATKRRQTFGEIKGENSQISVTVR